MSILGKALEFVSSDMIVNALDIPIRTLEKASKKIGEKDEKNKQKMFECAPGERALLINQKLFTWRDRFQVYDNAQNVKYSVEGEFTSIKHHLHIYNAAGKEIAFVKEKLLSLRPSAILEEHPVNFELEIGGRKIGQLRSKWSIGKRKYALDNGWEITGNVIGWKYRITFRGKTIATICMKPLYWGDTYLITFPEDENELLILLIVLAIDISNAPKRSEALKDTIHYKSHYWL